MAKKETVELPPGDPGWLTTWGDLVTLLMTFFVLIISFSEKKENSGNKAIKGLTENAENTGIAPRKSVLPSEGLLGRDYSNPDDLGVLIKSAGASSKPVLQTEEVFEQINEYLARTALNQHVETFLDNEELVMRVQADKIFKTNSAEFKDKNSPVLKGLFSILLGTPNDMIIYSPVDKSFIPSKQYMTEFKLSIDRSINLCKFFINAGGVAPQRIGVSEQGRFYTLTNNSDIIDNKLDYVEIVLLSSYTPLSHSKG